MKKYLLVSLTILFAAAFVWADEAMIEKEPDLAIEADATVSWGIDLGTGTANFEDRARHGFKNDLSWKVKFPLIKKGDKVSAKSEAPVYGEVTLKDIELNIQSKHNKEKGNFVLDGSVDKLEAKLVFYGAYLQVYNAPEFKTNYANLWDPIKKSSDYDDVKDDVTGKFAPGFEGFGTKIGYANKNFMDLDVGLKLGSNGNWESETDADTIDYDGFRGRRVVTNTDVKNEARVPGGEIWLNIITKTIYYEKQKLEAGYYLAYNAKKADPALHSKYGIGLDFSIKPLDKMLAIKLGINSTLASSAKYKNGIKGAQNNQVAFGFGAEIKSEPMEKLVFTLGFDGGKDFIANNKDVFAWDMLFKTEYKWISGGVYVASANLSKKGLYTPVSVATLTYPLFGKNYKELKDIADMAFYVKFETKGDKKEASYLVEGLDAGAYVGIYGINTYLNKPSGSDVISFPLSLKLWGSYKLNMSDSSWVKPFAAVWAETNHWENETTETLEKPYLGIAYNLGVTYSPVEKVEVTAKWEHGKEAKNNYIKLIDTPANKKAHNGRFTVALKVKY